MDRKLKIAAAVVVLLGAAVLVYAIFRPPPVPPSPTEFHFRCTACGQELVLSPQEAQQQDEAGGITCSNGHAPAAAVPMLVCGQCGKWLDRPAGGQAPACPHCGFSMAPGVPRP